MMNKKHYIIPVFIPELACPFQCVFCNQKKISGFDAAPSLSEIKKQIEEHLVTIDYKNSEIEIAFFGGNFTGISIAEQLSYLGCVEPYIEQNIVEGIRVSTRPDYINQEVLDLLKKYHVKNIELGAQSLSDEVLLKSGRGHKAADVEYASALMAKNGFKFGLQMMIGLPGDSWTKSLYTAKRIAELGASSTRIYPALVIKGTKLEKMYLDKKYQPLELDEAVEWTKELLLFFENTQVKVLRTGLHPSEGLLKGHELVAGPFHQSFKELVLTEIWHDRLKDALLFEKKSVTIEVNPKDVNYAIGYNSKNRKMLLENFREVNFIQSEHIRGGNFNVSYR